MGRHTKPSSRIPQRTFVAGVAIAAAGMSVSDSGSFVTTRASASVETAPLGVPAVSLAQPPVPVVKAVPTDAPDLGRPPVSGSAPVVSAPIRPVSVVVRSGETLESIASVHGQPWRLLWARNLSTVSNPNSLRPGQVLSLIAPPAPFPSPTPRPAPAVTGAVGAVSGLVDGLLSNRSDVVSIARTFFGVRYVWGGKSRAGVDCSGLVFLVLKQAGLTNTYRTSGALASWAKPISRSEARPGDLVFGPGHVGIYVGNGMMIDAPHHGSTVGLRKVYSNMNAYGRVPS